ncbi:MAG: EamA family transporter [Opitutae bacterium]|nr:EamA family transporter [Opitutae bacterium]
MTAAERRPTPAALIAGFLAIYLIWGSTYLAIRVAVETMPPFLMASMRFLAAGGLLSVWVAVTGGFRATPKQWLDNALIGGLLLLGGNGLVCWAEQKVPSGIATLIISVSPLFIVLLDWLMLVVGKDETRGTRPALATFAGLALGFLGLALLVGPDLGHHAGGLDPWRVAGLVLACLSWGAGSIYTRYARAPAAPLTGAAIQQLTGSVWLLVVSIGMGEPGHFHLAGVSGRSWLAWGYLVTAGSLVGFTTFVWLMKHSTPARVSTYAYINPVVAVFLGWLLLHEAVSPRIFVAAGIIIAGVAIITVAKNKKSVPASKGSLDPSRPAAVAAAVAAPAKE